MEVCGVVYLLIDGTNDCEYVGQTVQPLAKRFNAHASCKKTLIGRAIQKHGAENFVIAVLKACTSKEELDRWEKYFIKSRDTKNPNGYNLTDGGEGLAGMKHKPETIAKMSATKLGKKRSAETRAKISAARTGEKNPLFGKNRSLETCIKVSMKKRHNSPFKNLLREMDARKLSYRSLVKLLGLSSHASVSRRMRGEYNFTEKDKAKLEKVFGLSAEYLLQHDE